MNQIAQKMPTLWAGLQKARQAVIRSRVRLMGLGYVERPIKAGPAKGKHFVAAKRVFYSKLFWNGSFEREACDWLQRVTPPDGIGYDIGANLGYHTLVMAAAAPWGHVYAFEPIPKICRILERNIQLNHLPHVTIVDKAVTAKSGKLDLGWDTSLDQAALRFKADAQHPRLERLSCAGITLDDFVAEGNAPPSIMKIDVEGAEVDVLRGGAKVLATHRPTVVCEIHGPDAARGVYDLLGGLGYELFLVHKGLAPIRSVSEMPLQMDEGHVLAWGHKGASPVGAE